MEIKVKVRESFDNYHGKVWHAEDDVRFYHREDGPALIYQNYGYSNQLKEMWFYYNKEYTNPNDMPFNLFLAYCKWEYTKLNGN